MKHKTEPGRYRALPDSCKNRWCLPCQSARSFLIRGNLSTKLPDHPIRFLTLTVRSHDEPLQALIARLYRGFRRIKRASLWRERVSGGVAFLEVKRSGNNTHWHPHLHVLLQGHYLPKQELGRAWLEATGDSHVIDIRLIRDKPHALWYVTKYCEKTTSPTITNSHDYLVEAIEALHGKRTVIPFGAWRKFRLLEAPESADWELLGHENQLRCHAREGDETARRICVVLDTLTDDQAGDFKVPP